MSAPEPARSAADELVAIVDSNNVEVGSARRAEMRAKRLPHRSTYILVFDSRGRLFVQRRTMTKDVYPGHLDVAAGGVVLAGESFDDGARRELEEELGIAGAELEPLFEFPWGSEVVRVFGKAYRCVWDGPMRLQAEEIVDGEFVEPTEIVRRAASEKFTPDGMFVLGRYLARR
jgi:8-oxo-dGTP pyrophosphatase MutT (NUDIX family)